MSGDIESDYLVVGTGAAGMAFADQLLGHSDATITIVDRRHAPGGHWRDAYPYVRLHQPSTFYGVASIPLGADRIDAIGTNAGMYELAGPEEICAHFEQAMHRVFLPTGRVRYFPNCEYLGEGRFVSRLHDAEWHVRVRRKIIDTTYLSGEIPAIGAPPFAVADAAWCLPAGALARLDRRPRRYAVIGAGKTALDTCVWLLERGVAPSAITWFKPREAWWLNRRYQQPDTLLPDLYWAASAQFEAIAQASSVEDVVARLEDLGIFLRVDPEIAPTMFRGAIVSEAELALLRQIKDVVRLGHVRAIERDRVVLDEGTVPTDPDTVHVHCAASGLGRPPLRPIFEPGRVTVQPIFFGYASYQYSILGIVEATIDSDAEKNSLCPPIPYWDKDVDYLSSFLALMAGNRARARYPRIAEWTRQTRLNPTGRLHRYADDPRVVDANERIKRFAGPAAKNLIRLVPAG